MALEKGFYAQEGLDVKVAGIFKAGPELMSAFAAGALDVGYVGVAPATTAVANKTARVMVLAQANSEGSALVIRKDSRIQSVSELKGKTIAIPGHATVQDFLLHKVLAKTNLLDQTDQHHGHQTAGDDRGLEKQGHRRLYRLGAFSGQGRDHGGRPGS